MRNLSLALFATLLATPLVAQEKPINLNKAPGLDMVANHCAACHSLDYIQMNSPRSRVRLCGMPRSPR
jgi:hypothetical protein